LAALADVGYAPNCDRNGDLPSGRRVPKPEAWALLARDGHFAADVG
jgi:hypothetical protein